MENWSNEKWCELSLPLFDIQWRYSTGLKGNLSGRISIRQLFYVQKNRFLKFCSHSSMQKLHFLLQLIGKCLKMQWLKNLIAIPNRLVRFFNFICILKWPAGMLLSSTPKAFCSSGKINKRQSLNPLSSLSISDELDRTNSISKQSREVVG